MSWHKVKVGDFLIRVKNLITIEKDKEYSLVTIKLYHKGVRLRKKELGANISADKMSRVKAGQFILSGIDARNGAFGIVPPELDGAVVTNDFWHFELDKSIISKEYFLWLTSTPYFDDICNKASDGTTNRIRLQSDRFYAQELFIPEIENQHAVVEELKKQSNKISSLKNEYTLQLTQLDKLNQAILQEAVQGKLVTQHPDDESASELLKRIKAEKAISGKKEKPLPPIKPEEVPFDIPESWVWCRLDDIIDFRKDSLRRGPFGSSITKSMFIPETSPHAIKIFEQKNAIYKDYTLGSYYIDLEKHPNLKSFLASGGDIIISCAGTIGEAYLLPDHSPIGIINQALLKIRLNSNVILNEYFLDFFKAIIKSKVNSDAKGSAMKNLGSIKYLRDSLLIPLPPLCEQKRIIEEIEKQFSKTKQLKQHIITNQQATEQLLKALLHQAFEVKEENTKTIHQTKGKVVELDLNTVNWDNLVAQPFEQYAAHPANNIQDKDWEMAMMVACMKNKLGVTYGDVGLQKNVYNTNNLQPIFSKQYAFANSNFGTYCHELKEDLKRNPYLIAQKVANNKEVYAVNPQYSKQILDKLSAPENKEFIEAINRMLSIYEHPFINKETDKIELYNTVLKLALDKNTRNINNIYQGMKNWTINQAKYKTKAEKFSKSDAERMLKLLMEKKIL